jgi:hypothetical protein
MLVSSILGAAALMAVQADPTRASRDAYTRCLRTFMEKSVKDKTTADDFGAALARQCTDQETAYRSAIRAREANYKTPAGDVDQIISGELEDARENIKQIFEMSITPA